MITLYGFGANLGVVDPSPFVVKVDAFLRMAGLEYQTIGRSSNLKQSPKGKLPFITVDGTNGKETIADSQHIFDYLTEHHQVTLDDWLTDEQKAQAYLLTKSLDENLYWCIVYSRWLNDESWPKVKQAFFGKLPVYLRWFVPNMLRKSVLKTLYRQGTGRHSKAEILAIADKSFAALSQILSDKEFFFGDKVCSFDAVAYSFLCQVITSDISNSFSEKAQSYDNLVRFCQRIEKAFY
ncbi:glutathione S-transferase family protein [Litorilituus sediminis]|uniref:Glutathione S-transferase family protein n=1 Tax=Litorilituus sediminis TaxID=718192 RepID=A0A4P6P2L2_9GAMM|nr:glutathione S-transferase family protein [Litorilituus sediminis]QBG35686.1 glutathione S-transferase family protein [Litorilituus sediminis]